MLKRLIPFIVLLISVGVLVACATPTPQVIKETVVVTKEVEQVVKETVVVTKEIEKVVKETVVVTKEVEKVVTPTPTPAEKRAPGEKPEALKIGIVSFLSGAAASPYLDRAL